MSSQGPASLSVTIMSTSTSVEIALLPDYVNACTSADCDSSSTLYPTMSPQTLVGEPALQEAWLGARQRIASQCDGLRCDMAMLVLPEIFERTWGIAASPFWPRATAAIRAKAPTFLFLAEVYWDLEWTLQQQGFAYTYYK